MYMGFSIRLTADFLPETMVDNGQGHIKNAERKSISNKNSVSGKNVFQK